MSNSIKIALGTFTIVLAVCAISSVVHVAARNHKQTVLQGSAGPTENVAQAKASSLFSVNVTQNPLGDGSTIELDATIEAMNNVNMAEYTWILPEGFLANGAASGSFGSMQTGEKVALHLTTTGPVGTVTAPIHLHVYQMVKGEAMGQMAQAAAPAGSLNGKMKAQHRVPSSDNFMGVVQ
jgi:hypothetical protein